MKFAQRLTLVTTLVAATQLSATPVCVGDSDHDGDGWGWENGASCAMTTAAPEPAPEMSELLGQCLITLADYHDDEEMQVTPYEPVTPWPATDYSGANASCSDASSRILSEVKKGMHIDDVKRIVGAPIHEYSNGSRRHWGWTNASGTDLHFIAPAVHFAERSGLVYRIDASTADCGNANFNGTLSDNSLLKRLIEFLQHDK